MFYKIKFINKMQNALQYLRFILTQSYHNNNSLSVNNPRNILYLMFIIPAFQKRQQFILSAVIF